MANKLDKTKCFAGTYKVAVWFRSGLVCIGGFGQPKCPHLEKCIEQFRGSNIPDKVIDRAIKKLVTNSKN